MSRFAFDAESAILAAIMRDPAAYWRAADLLTPENFEQGDLRALWSAIAERVSADQPADAVTIADVHPRMGTLAIDLASSAAGATANVRTYAELLLKRTTERKVHQAGQRIAKLTGGDVLGEAQRILASCTPRASGGVASLAEFSDRSWNGLIERHSAHAGTVGIESGFEELDELTAGWQRADLIVIAARPSVGKTAFALQAALHAAYSGHPAMFVSLEMSGTQITDRALAHIGGVNALHIREPKRMTDEEWAALSSAKKRITQYPMTIDESAGSTVEAIAARIRQVNAEKRLALVVIDYLTYIKPPKADSTAEAIQEITRALKTLAKEIDVPVILLSQLSRDGEDAPELKHLRSSGAIEQDADVVIFLHRPEKADRDLIRVSIAKQRNGPLGDFHLRAYMPHMRFHPTTYEPPRRASGGVDFRRLKPGARTGKNAAAEQGE